MSKYWVDGTGGGDGVADVNGQMEGENLLSIQQNCVAAHFSIVVAVQKYKSTSPSWWH